MGALPTKELGAEKEGLAIEEMLETGGFGGRFFAGSGGGHPIGGFWEEIIGAPEP